MRDTTDRRGDERVLEATRRLIALLRPAADANFSVRLWDGSLEPLGHDVRPGLELQINSPGVLPSLVRWPSFDRVVRHFAHGRIDISGGTLLDLVGPHTLDDEAFQRIRAIPKRELLGHLLPFFTASGEHPDESRAFHGNITGHGRHKADNKAFIQFHYDVGNDFYRLFLDPEMQYSCGYFESWDESLETAQRAKLDHICRKLRLEPGDRLLDIGCGWGGLLCYAAQTYGVSGHGVTLSKQQLAFAQDKVRRLGLDDRVTLELRDYQDLTGTFDNIVSVVMYEHIGLANIPTYFRTVHRLLKPGGLFLNHAISRKAVWSRRWTRPACKCAPCSGTSSQAEIGRHRPNRHRYGEDGLRDPRCRGLEGALSANLQAVVRAAFRASRRGRTPCWRADDADLARLLGCLLADFPVRIGPALPNPGQ